MTWFANVPMFNRYAEVTFLIYFHWVSSPVFLMYRNN